ncbi:TetR/AcrR family transcriptional regulator [Mycolicibacterium sp. 120266]|uniref:TetR/AcrR family transcriptional regulator n=1 Tax=Mycolicibacterium sp. 120266 TaxID=3090601 RepID=UPI00299E889A|nr:TetR/AcrR family transcriptional regulator [Mycolicibacterium sp. 120266]MDX1871313.1 TetR/AcrR family transcriptional regulator [Mycolicibacterium sp. 120266]
MSMPACAETAPASGPRSRTRRAIIDAAVTVIAGNPAATMADIAAAAGVGRSTLHRYFSERSDLMRAVALHVHAVSTAAIAAADPACGPVDAALRRVVESQLDLGPIVLYIYTDPTLLADPELAAHLDTGDEAIAEVLARATADGPVYPPGWARRVFWALLLTGYDAIRQDGIPRHQVVDAIMSSLTNGTITSR